VLTLVNGILDVVNGVLYGVGYFIERIFTHVLSSL
jgi:hypothetical protein